MDDKAVAKRAAEVVERSQRALERGDLEGYLACFAQDAVLNDPASPPMTGREEIRKGMQGLLQAFSKVELVELKLFPVKRTVALKATIRFVTKKGPEATLEAVDVFDLNEDFKISKGMSYWDPEPLMKLLQAP